MQRLCEQAASTAAELGTEPSSYRGLSPFNSTRRNEPFQALDLFQPASTGLRQLNHFDTRFGVNSADSFVLQFIFNFLERLPTPAFSQTAFDEVWGEFSAELEDEYWQYFVVSNLKNFRSSDEVLDLTDGVRIHSRNYLALSELLGWSDTQIEATLGRDWHEGGIGSHVIIATSRLAKAHDNLVLANDPDSWPKLFRTLLAMRLTKAGFVTHGRIFFGRRARFRFGLGGISSSGYSRWEPGTEYQLSIADLPSVRAAYDALKVLDSMGEKVRALSLALRAFSSIYGRDHFRPEDRLVDSITAIEALLRIDTDLSFRSSFQVAGLLAADDDERVVIFRELRTFYDTRSKVVHGGELKAKHSEALQNYERLLELVRQLLSGFVQATASGVLPKDFYQEIDASLQHTAKREALRAMLSWTSE
jgi:hypothetical protein